jgi:hypothetical protein
MIATRNIVLCCFVGLLFCSSCNKGDALFTAVSSSKTHIDFENKIEKKELFGILYYLYYYNGGGVSVGDVNNDGLPDIYFTANSYGKNKLYLNKGGLVFEDITEKAGVPGLADWCSGVTMADVNGDGYLDIYVSAVSQHHGLNGKNQLYINNRNNTFKESAAEYGLDFSGFSTQAAFFDYDHDGDLDCYLLNHSQKPNENIIDTSNRRKFDPLSGDRFYRNDLKTTGKFAEVSTATGIYQSSLGYGLGISVADLNNDGWEDIYIGNDFHENDYYYLNNGNGTFTESGARYFGHYSRFSMGNDIGDFNNDGQLDIVTVDMLPEDEKVLKTYGSDEHPDTYKLKLMNNGYQYQYSKNCLQINRGSGTSFSETSLLSGMPATDWSWAPLFADFDNDGNKDLFISSGIKKRPVDLDYVSFVSNLYMNKGMNQTDKYDNEALEKMPDGSSHPYFFKGDGKVFLKDVSREWGTLGMNGYYNGAAYADLDNDGDLDLVMNCLEQNAVVLENNAVKSNYLSVSFRGDAENLFGVGAKAYIFQHGKLQYQQLMLTRGFQSSVEPRLHFGLNDQSTIDSLLVVWPDQQFQVIKNVPVNKRLTVAKKDASGHFIYVTFFKPLPEILEPKTGIAANWKHQENPFDDFNYQYLIPHCESTRGPKIAVGDVNGDGLDDFYACGANGQPGSLMVQQSGGQFTSIDSAVLNQDRHCEDVDATFFDANGDGKIDLYVVSGGNEHSGKDNALLDRLYLNDGSGHFFKRPDALPQLFENKSCVTTADVDQDGDTDIFIGNLANANAYGVPQSSWLLLNDGKAKFSIAPSNQINLAGIGMVTSAAFADLNKDGLPDLAATGEFMPMTIFLNKNGQFQKITVPNSTGWWQSVFIDDVNGDGHPDILAGNWGLNNKFWSGKNGPVKMYVQDFDKNGKVDQLMSYTANGKEFPFLAKDEVERPLPTLKKHYLLYADYAGEQMKDVFYGWIDSTKPVIAERFGSAIFFNDGKGGFTPQDLPANLQLAPIFTFQKLISAGGERRYIAGGNFFDVIPYEGRYDAQSLAVFGVRNDKAVKYYPQPALAAVRGQLRDLKWLRSAGEKNILMASRNNDSLLFYQYHR